MREVAKSMLGFSWAVSLFGVQQMARLMTQASVSPEAMASQFDEASRAVAGLLNEQVAQQFRAGDEWQRTVVDTIFDAASLQAVDTKKIGEILDPRPFIENVDARKVFQSGVDLAQKSFDTLRQTVAPQPASPSAS
jgi:hypothetical protein